MKVHNEGTNVLVTFTRSVNDLPQRFVLTNGTTYLSKYVVEFINLLCRTSNNKLSVELENNETESFVCVRGNSRENCECVRSGKIIISKSEPEVEPVLHSYTYKNTESNTEYSLGDSNDNIQPLNPEGKEMQNKVEENNTTNTTQKRRRSRKDEDKV